MVQIFSTFGLAIVMRGVAQFFFTPDYRSVTHSWFGGKTVSIGGIFLPQPQLIGAAVAMAGLRRALLLHQPHRFRPRARSHP